MVIYNMNIKPTKLTPTGGKTYETSEGGLTARDAVGKILSGVHGDFSQAIAFLENPENKKLLAKLESYSFGGVDITSQSYAQVQKVLDLMASKCPNLTSLSFGNLSFEDFNGRLVLPKFANLTTVSCQDIKGPLIFFGGSNLKSLSFHGTIFPGASIQFDEVQNLKHIDFDAELVKNPDVLSVLQKLETIAKTNKALEASEGAEPS